MGDFEKKDLPPILKNLFTGSATGLIDSIGNFINTPEAKARVMEITNAHLEKVGDQAIDLLKTQLADIQNARARETKISFSSGNWLNKNITSLIAIAVLLLCFGILYLAGAGKLPKEAESTIEVAKMLLMIVVTYYLGSSIGSKQKSDTIDTMTKKSE